MNANHTACHQVYMSPLQSKRDGILAKKARILKKEFPHLITAVYTKFSGATGIFYEATMFFSSGNIRGLKKGLHFSALRNGQQLIYLVKVNVDLWW